MIYDCAICVQPVALHPEAGISIAGVTKGGPDIWVWGPYPIHPGVCRSSLVSPYDRELDSGDESYVFADVTVPAGTPKTDQLLAHWTKALPGSVAHRFPRQLSRYGSDHQIGRETPWPAMDSLLDLRPARFVCLGTRARSREAEAGYDIAVHTAAQGTQVVLFAPALTPRNHVAGLTVDRTQPLTPDHVKGVLASMRAHGVRVGLVVIDRLQLMHVDSTTRLYGPDEDRDPDEPEVFVPQRPVRTEDDVNEVGVELKRIAMAAEFEQPPILLLARLERPRRTGVPLELADLGIAAELEYPADAVLLLDRTEPGKVSVLVAKDRSGPAPDRLTVDW
ncbi:DnaB-like helicase C-terminal domain-containing protein [Streptomyces sp. H39-C1]|uniref:DnaB-like helicase C-terminal domain-containing protein n=1 Tax=Streptomyces sp. H39-C1 TaxID=3004355 RepID=UPI0022AE84CE|nr:DnaB-like helicase C-terminal domain-containing protein [Streptomyces sp. H39-C1]MCZ4098013.1 hypothetical protein [Streptomyces sp. H39-C1]